MKHIKSGIVIFLALLAINACSFLSLAGSAQQQFEQGMSYFNRGEYRQALSYFKTVTELDPDYGEGYLYLGRTYLNLKQWGSAIPALRTAYRLSPGETRSQVLDIFIDGLINAALFETTQGNFLNAIGHLRETLELAPDNDKAQTALGKTLFSYGSHLVSKGNLNDAIPQFQEAITLTPNEFAPYLSLAKALFKTGNLSDAMATLTKATQLNPGNDDAQKLLLQMLMN